MQRADSLALPAAAWGSEYLEDTSLRRLVMEHYDQEHASLLRYLNCLGLDAESARLALPGCTQSGAQPPNSVPHKKGGCLRCSSGSWQAIFANRIGRGRIAEPRTPAAVMAGHGGIEQRTARMSALARARFQISRNRRSAESFDLGGR